MITYNDIYEAARKERYSEQLQPLNRDFIGEVAGYLKEKKEIASKKDDDFSDVIVKTKKQLENAVTIFKELMLRRRKKILNLILIAAETGISKQDFENMLDIEKSLFEDLMRGIDSTDKNIANILNGKKEDIKPNYVLFTADVEEFVGLDGEKLGPFTKGQMTHLPKEISNILFDDGKIELVEE